MDKEDARFQKLEQLHERRKQVVRLHLRGTGVMQIVALTGLSYPTVRKAVDLFEAGGWPAIKPAARGRSAGDGRRLSAEQEAVVRRTICDKRPEQLKMEFALWTRGAVMQYIEREFGVKLSIRATGEYLRRWASRPRSRSSGPTSSGLRPSNNGSITSTRPSSVPLVPREARSTGAMRRRW
jgi:transposase